MKRKVLCVFSVLCILLVFCTFLSIKAEEEMCTLVDARKGEGKRDRNLNVGNMAIIWKNTDDVLFCIAEGEGWESGLRIAEIPSEYFDRSEGHVMLGSGTEYWYIYSASRELVPGGKVTVVKPDRGTDTYLLWSPDDLKELDKLGNSMEVLTRSENAALVSNWSAQHPFFEHNIWYLLRNTLGEDLRVYSIHDVGIFVQALPWIAGVAAVLLCCLILWGASWILSGSADCGKGILAFNILLILFLLALVPMLLSQFDLPASMMPRDVILDISHYSETLGRIISSMNAMGESTVRNQLVQAGAVSGVVMGLSILLTSAIVVVEGIHCRGGKETKDRETE